MYAGSAQEVGTASVRLFVAFYLGLPFDLSTDIYLPESAAAILGERSLTPEQAAYLAAHTLANTGNEDAPQPAATQAPASSPRQQRLSRSHPRRRMSPAAKRWSRARPPLPSCWSGASPRKPSSRCSACPCPPQPG